MLYILFLLPPLPPRLWTSARFLSDPCFALIMLPRPSVLLDSPPLALVAACWNLGLHWFFFVAPLPFFAGYFILIPLFSPPSFSLTTVLWPFLETFFFSLPSQSFGVACPPFFPRACARGVVIVTTNSSFHSPPLGPCGFPLNPFCTIDFFTPFTTPSPMLRAPLALCFHFKIWHGSNFRPFCRFSFFV